MTGAIEKLIEAAEVALRIVDRNTFEVNGLRAAIAPARAELERMRECEQETVEARLYVWPLITSRTPYPKVPTPPYEGWRGIGEMLREVLDERDSLRAELAAARATDGREE